MASAEVVPVKSLCAPLAGDNPAGKDLRADPDSDFYKLKEIRAEARTLEERQSGAPDWAAVLKLATRILESQSKDIDVVCWLMEALVRIHRFAGFRDGMAIAAQVVGGFWESFYPPVDPEDDAQRLRNLGNLAGNGSASVLPWLRLTPLVEGSTSQAPGSPDRPVAISMFACQQAMSAGGEALSAVQQMFSAAREPYLLARVEEIGDARKQLAELQKVLDEKCPAASVPAVPLDPIVRVLDEIMGTYSELTGGKIAISPVAAEQEDQEAAVDEPQNDSPVVSSGGGKGRTRKQALNDIRQLAAFFESTEPQSLIGPALRQVASWGEMPLGDLLKTFVPDADHRKMFSWLGIEPKPSPS